MAADVKESIRSILQQIAECCTEKSIKIVTAESCTAGGVAYELTCMPGSSHWFERGFVTYSNLSKIELLGVDEHKLESEGAVSQGVARQMAQGALQRSQADLSLAITGIAGPTGGTFEKPVGTCWFAFAGHAFETQSQLQVFAGDRAQIRLQAIQFSLDQLLQLIRLNYD